jgi:hypothetical protein
MAEHNPDVDAWFESYDNPLAGLVQRVRDIVLDADPQVTEAIKWQAPTFMYRGNIASFFPKSKKTVTLMFHQGASIPDPDGLLEGDGDVARVARFADAAEVTAKSDALTRVVRAWIALRDAA